MKQAQEEKHYLNIAGEYGVCSELAKRGITGNVTFGNHKAADALFFNIQNRRVYIIEVKTTSTNRVVTGFFQKYHDPCKVHPDLWIIVKIDKSLESRYFIFTHQEMGDVQLQRNGMKKWQRVNGVDNVLIENILSFENKWDKVIKVLT